MTTTTTAADIIAEQYLAVCRESRSVDLTPTQRSDAFWRAQQIENAAYDAGLVVPFAELDEQARQEVLAANPTIRPW